MSYTKQTWVNGPDGGTPINADRLNYIETGIDTAHDIAEAAQTDADLAVTASSTAVSIASTAQPGDSELTALAALTSTSYGRALLELANQAALLGLIPDGSVSVKGLLELATTPETQTGASTTLASTPAGVKAVADTKRANINAIIDLVANTDYLETVEINDDGTATSGWPNRFVITFDPVSGETIQTFVNNEYGELRLIAAKANTVPFRIFERQFNTSTARNAGTPLIEIANNRSDDVTQYKIIAGGNVEQLGYLIVGTDLTVGDDLTVAGDAILEHVMVDRNDTETIPWVNTAFSGVLATSLQNLWENRISGTLRSWMNEWGALRGRVGAYGAYADALVRAIVQTGDFTGTTGNGGNAFEIEDRRLVGGIHRQRWARRWEDGSLVRNGISQRELYTWTTGDPDPTNGATIARPTNARYLILLEGAESAPSWVAENDIVLKVAALAATPAIIDTTASGVSLENVRDDLATVLIPSNAPQDGITITPDDAGDKIRFGINWRNNDLIERGFGYNIPKDGAATVDSLGVIGVSATGTATAAIRSITNRHTRARRIDYLVTVAATTAVAGWRLTTNHLVRGNASGVGGFYSKQIWGPATGVATATSRAFVGLSSATAAPTDVEPSTQTVMIGVGWDAADANMQMMYRNTGTVVKIDLGSLFPVPTTDRSKWFATEIWCDPNESKLNWKVTDLITGDVATGDTGVSTEIPPNTTYLCERGWMSVGATSSVIGIAFGGMFYEHEGW